MTDVITSAIATGIKPGRLAEGPSGARPKRAFSPRNIFIYGTLLVVSIYYLLPLYVMVVTSLKGMPEIRLGNIFAPPVEITFEPWVKAWATACTGLNCEGLSRGFWNSVRITIPSVILSIAIASVNGYALANWRFKGANTFFTILISSAPLSPIRLMLYPMVILPGGKWASTGTFGAYDLLAHHLSAMRSGRCCS